MTARCEWCGQPSDDLVEEPGEGGAGPGPIVWCRDAEACNKAREDARSGGTRLTP